MNMKYVNAIPLYRMEQEFARNDLVISRANMANWMIYSTEHYFSLMYDLLKSILCKQHVVQADETTCKTAAYQLLQESPGRRSCRKTSQK